MLQMDGNRVWVKSQAKKPALTEITSGEAEGHNRLLIRG